MLRLMMTLYPIVATTLVGMGVIAALTPGFGTVSALSLVAGGGLVLAVPVSRAVARALL